jgi:hypothetical protein
MRMTWGSTITAGITASVAIVIFMVLIPQLLGLRAIDITGEMGAAFSSSSPHMAGAIFLALMGIVGAGIFGIFYNSLPGNYVTKGALFGLMVGLFSLAVLPNIITTLSGIIGATGQYAAIPLSLNATALVSLIAYVIFGLILAWNYRPLDSSGNA